MAPGTGAALRMLAASVDAKAVAEIGTGTGVSGIDLLHGMRPDGVRTTVDTEPSTSSSPGRCSAPPGSPATGPGSSRAGRWRCCPGSRTPAMMVFCARR
ncbi:O-methyltransferase OS=Streptomyces glaucescens OX=1907 GN=SGLAU_22050 PE=4 SV=1 [Streptomyces glaucescens]